MFLSVSVFLLFNDTNAISPSRLRACTHHKLIKTKTNVTEVSNKSNSIGNVIDTEKTIQIYNAIGDLRPR